MDWDRIIDAPHLQTTNDADMINAPLCEMVNYVHNIMEDNDPDTAE